MVKPSRLTRNRHGTYCLRWIVPADLRAPCERRREVRVSLRTTDPNRARILALEFNLALERIKAMGRSKTPPIGVTPMTLTIGNMSIDVQNDNDRQQLNAFLRENPDIRERMLASIRAGSPAADAMSGLIEQVKTAASAIAGVAKPTALSDAIESFIRSRQGLARNSRSTAGEKGRTLRLFQEHIESDRKPGTRIFVHDILRSDVLAFINAYASRPGKGASKTSEAASGADAQMQASPEARSKPQDALSSRTVVKAVGHLRDFFTFALGGDMVKTSPLDDAFDRAIGHVRKEASAAKHGNSYELFSELEIRQIFEPRRYLAHMNAADDFWAPLIGLFTGARLGEIVSLPADGIKLDTSSGVFVMHIEDNEEDGRRTKNRNSIRKVPVPDALIRLGLTDYIQHVQRLGAKTLFPHRPLNPTRMADPSKHVSRVFGEYLDVVGITDRSKTFHSFRHTAVTLMHVGRVPVADAVLVVGHAAQDQLIRMEAAGAFNRYGSSTHLDTYVHAKGVEQQDMKLFDRLKRHMDRTLQFPLDFDGLRAAASIVQETTVRDGPHKFKSGWHTNNKRVAEQKLAALDDAIASAQAARPATTGESP